MKKLIPSFLTILNLVCGCLAIVLAFQFQFSSSILSFVETDTIEEENW